MTDLRAEADRDLLQIWCGFIRAKDVDGIMTLYADDCQYMTAGAATIEGKAAMRKYYENMFDGEVVPADAKGVMEEAGSLGGDLSFLIGTVESFKDDGTSLDKVRFMSVAKRVDGKLRIYRDMDNRTNQK